VSALKMFGSLPKRGHSHWPHDSILLENAVMPGLPSGPRRQSRSARAPTAHPGRASAPQCAGGPLPRASPASRALDGAAGGAPAQWPSPKGSHKS
jgi:hypothetical protein